MQIALELQERGLALGGTWHWPAKAREKEERKDQAKSCCKAVQAQCSQEDRGQSRSNCALQATSRNPQRYRESPDSCGHILTVFELHTQLFPTGAVACATARKACWNVVTACLYPKLRQVSVDSISMLHRRTCLPAAKFLYLAEKPPHDLLQSRLP